MKALIVDDNDDNLMLLEFFIKPVGTFETALTGKEGISMFEQCIHSDPYDVVCLDICMPDINGQEVLKKIKEIERESEVTEGTTKVIMTSAVDDPQTVLSLFQDKCDGYLTKPIQRNKLWRLMYDLKLLSGERLLDVLLSEEV